MKLGNPEASYKDLVWHHKGQLEITVYGDGRIAGKHRCNFDSKLPLTPMRFVRPSKDHAVLVCQDCCFRLEITNYEKRDFSHPKEVVEDINYLCKSS